MYKHIHVYRCTPVDAEPSIRARVYINTRIHEEMGCRQPQMEPPLCVCACVCAHLGIRTFLEAQASMQAHTVRMGTPHPRARAHAHMRTLPWSRFAHSYTDIYMHSYIRTQMCARSGTRLVGARVRRSTYTHTRLHGIYTHTYACTCTHTYEYTHGDTHLHVARPCCAAAPAARATRTRTHAQARAHTHAETHATSARIHPYMRAYTCR